MNPQTDRTPDGMSLPRPSADEPLPKIAGVPNMPPDNAAQTQSVPQITGESPRSPEKGPATPAEGDQATSASAKVEVVPTPQNEEGNVVDREWIDRALEAVERNHADPYMQSKEISRIKAEYIKARYNKEIKSVED